MSATGRNPFETDLDKNPANYMPMHPSRFLERAAEAYPGRTAMIHGARPLPMPSSSNARSGWRARWRSGASAPATRWR